MSDRISRYRYARLTLHVPPARSPLAHWSLSSVAVSRGIPDLRVLQLGVVPLRPINPSEQEVWEALSRVVGEYTLF